MAQRTAKASALKARKRRQPTKSSLSGVKKSAPTTKAVARKRPVAAPKPKTSKKVSAPVKKTTVTKRAKAQPKRQIAIPFGRGTKLVLSLQVAKTKPAKKKPTPKKPAKSKQRELIITLLYLAAGLAGSAFFGVQAMTTPNVALAASTAASKPVMVSSPKSATLPRSLPSQLRIPSIELNTSLTSVGLATDGSIQVPVDYTTAGWYDQSPTPGETGPAIIVGHLDHVGGTAVFWRLRELLPGQSIEVDRADGKTATFTIEKVQQFPQDNFPAAEVYGDTDHPTLRLITCGGVFNRLTGHYSDNTVVFASLVEK